ncbi:hypothetical protein C8F04DRAFT_1116693 [Mycena alexandri]|uniref:Uncharacterized protein n=1 Tax=Mycena alexandri TaxID=1745969 RepID=A0AAD6SLC3_9AGAR|nr:hypothetical protein C8F04DRAFT_1116693 [Mycena alexandri]
MAFAAAANASSHASTSALTVAKREITPAASPFAHLLRSSRFAQFDPQIRKTYYSPKQFVERGYWGLKRPISQRKRNSFVTIKQWEARQHYIEWDNAEDQIRFIRRMEEVDVRPVVEPRSSWGQQLGTAKDDWLVDSEFSPHDWGSAPKAKTEEQEDIPLDTLGNKGPGEYGAHAPPYTPTQHAQQAAPAVIPNVMAMSPGELKRYLQKLRALRPAFMAYLDREAQKQQELKKEQDEMRAQGKFVTRDPRPTLAGLTLAQLSQYSDGPYHRVFLAEHTLSEYNSTRKIQPQPHRNGALTYTHPAMLDPLFRTKSKPGIILSHANTGRWKANRVEFLAAFAGVVAHLNAPATQALLPLLDPDLKRENWVHAVAEMRPVRRNALHLLSVPRVVGATPDERLSGVKIALHITTSPGFNNPQRPNPFAPGSRQYIAVEPTDGPRAGARGAAAAMAAPSLPQGPPPIRSLTNPPGSLTSGFQPQTPYDVHVQTRAEQESNRNAINVLQNLLRQDGKAVPDEQL